MDRITDLGIIFSISFFITMLLGLALYVITSYSTYRLAINNGYKDKAFLAWIPIAQFWLISIIVGEIRWGNKRIPSIAIIIIYITVFYFNGIITSVLVSLLMSLIGALVVVVIYYELFRRIENINNALVLSVVSAFVPIVFPIIIFINRDAKLKDVDEIDYERLIGEYLGNYEGKEEGYREGFNYDDPRDKEYKENGEE